MTRWKRLPSSTKQYNTWDNPHYQLQKAHTMIQEGFKTTSQGQSHSTSKQQLLQSLSKSQTTKSTSSQLLTSHYAQKSDMLSPHNTENNVPKYYPAKNRLGSKSELSRTHSARLAIHRHSVEFEGDIAAKTGSLEIIRMNRQSTKDGSYIKSKYCF